MRAKPLMPLPAHRAAPRRPFVLAALLAVVAALSVDAQALLERWWPQAAAAALPQRGESQRAIEAAFQLGEAPRAVPGRARMTLLGLDSRLLREGTETAVRLAAQVDGGLHPRYRWNFGDGTPDTDWSVLHAAHHRFQAPGTYLVRLTVVDDQGQRLDHVQTITVAAAGQPD